MSNISNIVNTFKGLGFRAAANESGDLEVRGSKGVITTISSSQLKGAGDALSLMVGPAGVSGSSAARFGSAKDMHLKSAENFAMGLKRLAGIIGMGPAAAIAGASLKPSVDRLVAEARTGHLTA